MWVGVARANESCHCRCRHIRRIKTQWSPAAGQQRRKEFRGISLDRIPVKDLP